MKKKDICELSYNIYEENSNYVDRAVDSIYRHFESIGKTWGFNDEKITRDMIEETILELINDIVESEDTLDCDEAGTGGIIVRLEYDPMDETNPDYYELTIMLEF